MTKRATSISAPLRGFCKAIELGDGSREGKVIRKMLRTRGEEPSLHEKWLCINVVLQGQKEMQQKGKSAKNKTQTLSRRALSTFPVVLPYKPHLTMQTCTASVQLPGMGIWPRPVGLYRSSWLLAICTGHFSAALVFRVPWPSSDISMTDIFMVWWQSAALESCGRCDAGS